MIRRERAFASCYGVNLAGIEARGGSGPSQEAVADGAAAQKQIPGLGLDDGMRRNLTHTKLAQALRVNQGAVSKMEKRTDMYVSRLQSYLQAMGAEVQIKAIFPDGEVLIGQFEDLDHGRDDPAA